MKTILYSFIATAILFTSCGGGETETKETPTDTTAKEETQRYGDSTFTEDGVLSMEDFKTQMAGKDSMELKLSGTIEECCQKKGCWMTMDMGDGNTMRVTFKDYGFFMPKNSAGMTAVLKGWAKVDTLSVELQKHYLEDAEAPQEEIDAITEPLPEWSFVADGVILKSAK